MNVKTRMVLLVSTLGAAAAALATAPLAQTEAHAQRADRAQSAVPDLARVVSTMNLTAIPN